MSHLIETDYPGNATTDLQSMIINEFVRRGSICPNCRAGKLNYNGLLELECDQCGYSLVEGAGCS